MIAFIAMTPCTLKAQVVEEKTSEGFNKLYYSLRDDYRTLGNIRFSGIMRMTGYYRAMSDSYDDMLTSDKSLAFSPYPVNLADAAGGSNRGQPFLELVMEGAPRKNAYFKVGYSLNHSFLGLGGDSARQMGVRQFLKFEGNTTTQLGKLHLVAGGGSNWVSMSPLTLSRKEFRIEPFEKIPWDWYTNSPKKYFNYQKKATIRTDERFGQAATQGFSAQFSDMPANFGLLLFYGKTNRNLSPNFADFPMNTFTTRINNNVSEKSNVGLNFYKQFGHTDRINAIRDQRQILTTDITYKTPTVFINAEIGGGGIVNPLTNDKWETGEAINIRMRFAKSVTKIPLSLNFYDIHHNVVSQESAGFNSNVKAPSGGVTRNIEFDGNMFVNILQEVDMVSNNRLGTVLRLDETVGRLKIEFGNALSVEKENLYDTITIQHRVNSFSRSRFTPFGSSVGPYQRIRNRFMRSYETLGVTDSVSNYKKGFNMLDLTLKYKLGNRRKKGLILVNYVSAGSVGEGLKVIPGLSDASFYRQFYEEFSAYYVVRRNLVLMGFVGFEKLIGNNRTIVSAVNGKPLDQSGKGFGVGVDWDFIKNGGLFIRHKWFSHSDENFVLDTFKGQETSLEIKIFF